MLRKLLGKILGSSKKAAPASPTGTPRGASPRPAGPGHPPSAKSGGPAHGPSTGGRGPRTESGRGQEHRPKPATRPEGDRPPRERDGSTQNRPPGQSRDRDRSRGPNPRDAQGSSAQGHGPRPPQGRNEGDRGERGPGEGDRRRGRGGRGGGGGGGGRGRGPDREFAPRDRERSDPRPPTDRADNPTEPLVPATAIPEVASAPIVVPAVTPDSEFSDLGLEPFIVAAIEAMGYQQPTPIQSEAIPMVLSGRDVIGSAQTGTGKTAAFGLPILQKLRAHGSLRCLILEPTRELAVQVDEAFQSFSKFTDLRAAVIFGGVGYGPQRDALRRGLDIVVATPGRLLDLLSQGDLSLKGVDYLVLDEVDRMLDMGFLPDVKRIIEMCKTERQTLFFSATIPPELEGLTKWCLRDPHTIEIGRRRAAAETVSHAFYPVIESQKLALLHVLLERTNYESVLIFCRTKHGADFVAGRLEKEGHKVAVMHSNRSQTERMDALKGFKSGKYEVMVATDLAARGLDIAGVTHVVNYDTPQHAEDYVHRIGRTGRAQTEGDAFTLLTEDEMKHAFAIERFIGQKVERKKLDDFPYQYSAIFESAEGAPKNVFRSRLYRGTRK